MSYIDVPENEIEITPEMIEAGTRELALFSPEGSQLEDVCVDIFSAMIAARKSKAKPQSKTKAPGHLSNQRQLSPPSRLN